MKYINALDMVREKWKDNGGVRAAGAELAQSEAEMEKYRSSDNVEDKKAMRMAWSRATTQYWELVWAITEANIDTPPEPPEHLVFDEAEKMIINFGYLSPKSTTENEFFDPEMGETASLDIYQYGRLTDFLAENYSLLFGKPYQGPSGGVSLQEKMDYFANDLETTFKRRRLVITMVFSKCGFITPDEVNDLLRNMEEHHRIYTEMELRTKRVREADSKQKEKNLEQRKRYEIAERSFLIALDRAEKEVESFTESEHDKILSLHDRTHFLTHMEVHVKNEADRWKTRIEMNQRKHKGKGVPALKGELRDAFNQKKEFITLAARSARLDISPLNVYNTKPIGFKRAGDVMMEMTPLDPDMLRAARVRMYGIPRVIITPGHGLGVYDWTDNSIIVPQFSPYGADIKSFCFALGAFRWDNDEDRILKDSYGMIKENKDKGIRALQEAFCQDYFIWLSKERKGYRVLPKDTSKWFKTYFIKKSQ